MEVFNGVKSFHFFMIYFFVNDGIIDIQFILSMGLHWKKIHKRKNKSWWSIEVLVDSPVA